MPFFLEKGQGKYSHVLPAFCIVKQITFKIELKFLLSTIYREYKKLVEPLTIQWLSIFQQLDFGYSFRCIFTWTVVQGGLSELSRGIVVNERQWVYNFSGMICVHKDGCKGLGFHSTAQENYSIA